LVFSPSPRIGNVHAAAFLRQASEATDAGPVGPTNPAHRPGADFGTDPYGSVAKEWLLVNVRRGTIRRDLHKSAVRYPWGRRFRVRTRPSTFPRGPTRRGILPKMSSVQCAHREFLRPSGFCEFLLKGLASRCGKAGCSLSVILGWKSAILQEGGLFRGKPCTRQRSTRPSGLRGAAEVPEFRCSSSTARALWRLPRWIRCPS